MNVIAVVGTCPKCFGTGCTEDINCDICDGKGTIKYWIEDVEFICKMPKGERLPSPYVQSAGL